VNKLWEYECTELPGGVIRVTLEDGEEFLFPGEGDKHREFREIQLLVESRMLQKKRTLIAEAALRQTDAVLRELAATALHPEDVPPVLGEALISLLTPKQFAQAQLGDMQEMFEGNVRRFGLKRAKRLYWYEVVRSIGPLLFSWMKRIGIIAFLVEYGRRKLGL
jgi:hypothetical protein